MTALVRAFPWDGTPLGDRRDWPAHRTGVVDALLLSPAPMASFWGGDGIAIFNDAFAALLPCPPADRLGRPAGESWPEVADLVGAVQAGRAAELD